MTKTKFSWTPVESLSCVNPECELYGRQGQDILSLYVPGTADELAKTAGETPITQLMLGGAIMMEISIVMIVLSRVLKYKVNRWVNIIASIITIVFVVGGGVSYPHYIFIKRRFFGQELTKGSFLGLNSEKKLTK